MREGGGPTYREITCGPRTTAFIQPKTATRQHWSGVPHGCNAKVKATSQKRGSTHGILLTRGRQKEKDMGEQCLSVVVGGHAHRARFQKQGSRTGWKGAKRLGLMTLHRQYYNLQITRVIDWEDAEKIDRHGQAAGVHKY